MGSWGSSVLTAVIHYCTHGQYLVILTPQNILLIMGVAFLNTNKIILIFIKMTQCSNVTFQDCSHYLWTHFPSRSTIQSPQRRLSPLSPSLPGAQAAAVMAAPAPLLSPRAQHLSTPWTPPSTAIKMSHHPLSSPPAHSHPPRWPALHFLRLDLTATRTARRAPEAHLTPRDAVPPLITTGPREVQPVTKRGAHLQASHLTLLQCTPPWNCWVRMTTARWVAGRHGRTEAPLLWLSNIQCPTRSREILASGNLVSNCGYPAVI